MGAGASGCQWRGGGTQGLRATGTSGWNLGCGNPRAAQMALPKKNHGFRVLTPEFLKTRWGCAVPGITSNSEGSVYPSTTVHNKRPGRKFTYTQQLTSRQVINGR